MTNSNKIVGNATLKLREKLNEITSSAEKKSKKSNMSYEEFIKVAKEAGKTFDSDDRNNNRERYLY